MMRVFFILFLFNFLECTAQDIQKTQGILIYDYLKLGDGDHYFIPLNNIDSADTLQSMLTENNLGIGFHVKYLNLEWRNAILEQGKSFINKSIPNNNEYIKVALVEVTFSYHPLASRSKTNIVQLPIHLFEKEIFFKYDAAKYFLIDELKILKTSD